MANMIPISTTTIGASGASIITFSSIPQTYTDLLIKISARSDRAATPNDYFKLKINSSSSSYNDKSLYGNGSGLQAEINNSTTYGFMFIINAAGTTSNTFSNTEIYIPNYTGNEYKPFSSESVAETNGTTAITALNANLWSNTSPITSITLEPSPGPNFVQYSSATLYGIRKY